MRTLIGMVRSYKAKNLSDAAAALTYYSILSIFPAALALVAVVGVFGSYPETTNAILGIVEDLGPGSAVDTFRRPVEDVVRSSGGAGALLGIGLLGALWSASAYVGAFMRAADTIYEVDHERRIWRKLPLRIGLTVLLVILLAFVAMALVLTGRLAEAVGRAIGVGDTAVTIWQFGKWPVLILVIGLIFAILYFAAPNVRHPGFKAVLPGGLLAIVLWAIASFGFALYLAFFGSYNKTYGSLGAVIIFLVWLYLSNSAILLGAVFNAERERTRELERGLPADEKLRLEPRDTKA
jgi:membrane protein